MATIDNNNAFYKLNLNLVPSNSNRKLTTAKSTEFSSDSNGHISQAADTASSRALASAVDNQHTQQQHILSSPAVPTGTLSCSNNHSKDSQDASTVTNMVLSQPPLQVRSTYYVDYQKPGFDDSFPNYQSFASRQHLSQYQNTPQFTAFTNNAKSCYNNNYSKYGRTYQFEPKMGMKGM